MRPFFKKKKFHRLCCNVMFLCRMQGEVGEHGQKGAKGGKGEHVSDVHQAIKCERK